MLSQGLLNKFIRGNLVVIAPSIVQFKRISRRRLKQSSVYKDNVSTLKQSTLSSITLKGGRLIKYVAAASHAYVCATYRHATPRWIGDQLSRTGPVGSTAYYMARAFLKRPREKQRTKIIPPKIYIEIANPTSSPVQPIPP
jgi:hypothetical protein